MLSSSAAENCPDHLIVKLKCTSALQKLCLPLILSRKYTGSVPEILAYLYSCVFTTVSCDCNTMHIESNTFTQACILHVVSGSHTLHKETLTLFHLRVFSSDWCPWGRCECGGVRRQLVPAALLWQRWRAVQGVGQTDAAGGQTTACWTAGRPPRRHHLHPQQGGGAVGVLSRH